MNPKRWLNSQELPQNFRFRDASPDSLGKNVDHALETVRGYLAQLPGEDPAWLKGKNTMEIGPGIHYGVPLILACFGAQMIVTDRFPPVWQPTFHPAFYALLLERLVAEFPGLDQCPLEAIIRNRASLKDYIIEFRTPVESIPRSLRNRCDVIFSNAVLEHLFLPSRAIRRLALITRPGGFGFHQIDFRDHRDFIHPLEYLLLDRIHFWKIFHWSHGECGNRLRSDEFSRIFIKAGFAISKFDINVTADEDYLESFLPKLRAASSIYAKWPETELKTLSGRFHLVKT